MNTAVRLALNAFLIYEVAHGRVWALVVFMILSSLAHEATAWLWRNTGPFPPGRSSASGPGDK